jgi:hypothetical protein
MPEIVIQKSQLDEWMKPTEAPVPRALAATGHKAIIYRDPYGVALIIGASVACPSLTQSGPQMGEVITPALTFARCREATRLRGGVSPSTPRSSALGELGRRSRLWQRRQ